MDYHSDRFIDSSILVYEDDILVALMPANLHNDKISITSHSGLTFGSFIVKEHIRSCKTIEYIFHSIKFLFKNNIQNLYFKQIPSFYNNISTDEVVYAFFILDAEIDRVDFAYAINYQSIIPYQQRRVRSIKKAKNLNVQIINENKFDSFWNQILIPNLKQRFGVNPVHSLEEIRSLSENNPYSIIQYNAYLGETIMAGTTLFVTPNVVHAQYISASEEGRKNGSLDLLFDFLIKKYSNKMYFDFGIVNENFGKTINSGLLDWKEGFGARAYAHRFYKIETSNYIKLEKLIY
jgi:hypothetical protein